MDETDGGLTRASLGLLVDSQVEIVELIAASAPLETILSELTTSLEKGWEPFGAHALVLMTGGDDSRSIAPSPALRAALGEARGATHHLLEALGSLDHGEHAAPITVELAGRPGFDSIRDLLGTNRAWVAPMDSTTPEPDLLVLLTSSEELSDEDGVQLLKRYARLAELAVDRHRGELRLHRLIAEERARLAGVLHDDPIQAMTAVSLRVQRLARHVEPDAIDMVLDLQKSVTTAIDRMRRLLIDLHPPTLDNEGLVSAIDVYLAEVLEPLDIECELIDLVEDEPTIETASLAYRVAVEALWNVAKHARAQKVVVTIAARSGAVDIEVRDDGVGFDVDQRLRSRAGHMGLSACRALAARASGGWNVDSRPGEGTTVSIHLPGETQLRSANRATLVEDDSGTEKHHRQTGEGQDHDER